MLEINKIHHMDVRDGLKALDDQCIDCIVTSPPYWCQRDYGYPEQIGMESTPEEYVNVMGDVFSEALRVLKDRGTMWMNIGDTYLSGKGRSGTDRKKREQISTYAAKIGQKGKIIGKDGKHPLIRPKETVGIPWMVAFELRRRGWMIRQDIIWHKTNAMPETATDRCTKAHEYLFLFTKQGKYHYDAYAIATPYKEKTKTTWGTKRNGDGQDGRTLVMAQNWANTVEVRKPKVWKNGSGNGQSNNPPPAESGKANKRSVWPIGTRRYKGDHYATFPEALVTDCIKAGCLQGGLVLDPFAGRNTTGLVARKLNRNFIGFELNERDVSEGEKRLYSDLGLFM